MDSDLQDQLDELSSNITTLEAALQPLTSNSLSTSTSKLPLLDKAKLYVLSTYALESLLFSFLRLNGVEAADHPIKQELNRVKEYFAKIKTAEEVGAGGRALGAAGRLDKEAAGRFIKHGLAGNERYDRERKERQERERAGAKRKLDAMNASVGTHTRFDGAARRMEEETVPVVSAKSADEDTGDEIVVAQPATKKQKGTEAREDNDDEIVVARPQGRQDADALDALEEVVADNTQGKKETASAAADEGRRLYVGNLAYATIEGDVREFFKDFVVENTQLPENARTKHPTGYAFVDVSSASEAERAVDELNRKSFLDRTMSVQLARKSGARTTTTSEAPASESKSQKKKGKKGKKPAEEAESAPSEAPAESESKKKRGTKGKKNQRGQFRVEGFDEVKDV